MLDIAGSTTTAKHGFPHGPPSAIPANRDDYCEGETYTSVAVATTE